MSRERFKPGIYDSLLLKFAVAHKLPQPSQPNETSVLIFWMEDAEEECVRERVKKRKGWQNIYNTGPTSHIIFLIDGLR